MRFRSGPFAITDLHNGGSIIGIIYHEVLVFGEKGEVALHKEIELDRSGGNGWKESLQRERWTGTFELDADGKHVKCSLRNAQTQEEKIIYADSVGENGLIAEVYSRGSMSGIGQVFTRML
jgi:hypothetical protein